MGNCMQRRSIFTMVFIGSNGLGRVLALVGHGGELGSELEYSSDLQIRLRVKGTHHVLEHDHKVACQYVGLTHGRSSEPRRQVEVELEFFITGQSSHLVDPGDDCA